MSSVVALAAAAFFMQVAGVSANRAINQLPLTAKDGEKRDYRYVPRVHD